jgi:plastocyanin
MRRLVILTSLVAVVILALFTYGAASAGTASVTIGGTEHFTPNALVNSTFHFRPGPIMVRSGDPITFTNTTGDPHTISVVKEGDLPTTIGQVFECGAPGTICDTIFQNLVPGLTTLSKPYDTVTVGQQGGDPFFGPDHITVTITAPSGSTLHYMCAIHPWMQGTINVK